MTGESVVVCRGHSTDGRFGKATEDTGGNCLKACVKIGN